MNTPVARNALNSSKPFVTVAICTWNRAELLDKTLSQFRELKVCDEVNWQLVVVNNNSTDATDTIVSRHLNHLPVKPVFESKPGLSHARNAAVQVAEGDLLIWTDDDVLVDPDWLNAYVRAAERWPDASYFGGPVVPWLEKAIPDWMKASWQDFSAIYAIREKFDNQFPLPENIIPVGANMACRMSLAKKYPYDPELGRTKDVLLGGEESVWFANAYANGHKGAWVGNALLKHYLPAHRLTKEYVAKWYAGAGMGAARRQTDISFRRINGYPAWAIKQLAIETCKRCLLAPFGASRWVSPFLEISRLKGYLRESKRLHQQLVNH